MASPGPRPTPTNILKNRGSWRAKVRAGEPQPQMGKPRCPGWLNGRARAEYKRMCKLLDDMGILAHTDGNALARYCLLWHRWLEAEEVLALYGQWEEIKDAKGFVVSHKTRPQVQLARDLSRQLSRLEAEFGLTPSSRTKVVAEESEESSNRGGPGKSRYFSAG